MPPKSTLNGGGEGVRFKSIFCVKSALSEENNKNMRKFLVVPRTFVQDCRNLDHKLNNEMWTKIFAVLTLDDFLTNSSYTLKDLENNEQD